VSVKADNYFAIVPEWVIYADISSQAVRLYCALRRHADKSHTAHPSQARLAELTFSSINTVKRSLRELDRIGAVRITPRLDGEGRRTSNDYLLLSAPAQATHGLLPPPTHGLGAQATHGLENQSPSEPEPLEPEEELAREFESFWPVYPRRIDKGHARKAFKAARKKGVSLEVILAAVAAYAESVKGSEARFIAHPATWLRGERWTDEVPPDTTDALIAATWGPNA
jgi:hypothetical protein